MKRYPRDAASTLPRLMPVTDGGLEWRALYLAAGLAVPERPGVSRLARPWQGHRAGALVLLGDASEDGVVVVFDR